MVVKQEQLECQWFLVIVDIVKVLKLLVGDMNY